MFVYGTYSNFNVERHQVFNKFLSHLAVQEGIAVQIDVCIIYAGLAQSVPHPLARHGGAHQRY